MWPYRPLLPRIPHSVALAAANGALYPGPRVPLRLDSRGVEMVLSEREAAGVRPIGAHETVEPDLSTSLPGPDEQAEITIAIVERNAGRQLTADEIENRAAVMRDLAAGLERIAARRRAAEAHAAFSLDEIEVTPQ